MAATERTVSLSKKTDGLTFVFPEGHSFTVDLSKQKLDAEQHQILEKAVRSLNNSPESLLAAERGCPAQSHLTPAEFERIRGLRATLGTSGASVAAGVIADFCLHVVKVGS